MGDRISDASEGQADEGMAGARAIALPKPNHSPSLSLLFPAIAQAKPLPLLQPTRLRLVRAGRSHGL
jgi:hypothetical protein